MKEKKEKREKTQLVRIGKHYIAPDDVIGIKQAKQGLHIIMLRSDPEPQFPLWLSEKDLEKAKEYFDILGEQP